MQNDDRKVDRINLESWLGYGNFSFSSSDFSCFSNSNNFSFVFSEVLGVQQQQQLKSEISQLSVISHGNFTPIPSGRLTVSALDLLLRNIIIATTSLLFLLNLMKISFHCFSPCSIHISQERETNSSQWEFGLPHCKNCFIITLLLLCLPFASFRLFHC